MVSNPFGTRGQFCEDNFFMNGAGDDFRAIQAHYIYCVRFVENRRHPRFTLTGDGAPAVMRVLRRAVQTDEAAHSPTTPILLFLTGGLWPRGRGQSG